MARITNDELDAQYPEFASELANNADVERVGISQDPAKVMIRSRTFTKVAQDIQDRAEAAGLVTWVGRRTLTFSPLPAGENE